MKNREVEEENKKNENKVKIGSKNLSTQPKIEANK